MSFPDRAQRKACWDSRDKYWECLDEQNVKDSTLRPIACANLRKIFEKSCPTQWVTHFDRKRDFNVFKEKMQKEGYEPIRETKLHIPIHANMEEFIKLSLAINIPTPELTSASIQEVLTTVRRRSQVPQDNTDFWNEVTRTLWHHLQNGLAKFDDQLLCATCFYTVLGLSDKQDYYLNMISNELREQISLREKSLKGDVKTLQAVSLMYGTFQSSFLTQDHTESSEVADLLQVTFNLLMLMAYEYSKYTFIVFKTISSFKKVCGTDLQGILFSKQNNKKLLNVVNHNWENPITGVRDLNKGIFRTLITVIDKKIYNNVLKEINVFFWNKAKYLMLAEIITESNQEIGSFIGQDWIYGLLSSLQRPGLVSAGADMYFSLFKKVKSEEQWCQFFKQPIVDILCGKSRKGIENFSNYWSLTTFKSYPNLAEILLNELEHNDQENRLYSSLCIIKQANKLGLVNKNWEITDYSYIENSILEGLEHMDNQIRTMAFNIVCISHSKSLPGKANYELVLNYLNNNINSDCTVLRISMLKNLSSFLTQIHMSYLNYLKTSDEIEHLKYFCGKFQDFIIHNLKICGNYQRKITCIKLVHSFLNGLKEVPRKRLKQTRKSDKSIIKMLEDEGKWSMTEEIVTKSLLKYLMDPAQDIRQVVGQLLLEHYSRELRKTKLINILIEDGLKSMTSKFFYEISCGQSMFKLIVNILIFEEVIEAKFKTVKDIFNYALEELIKEHKLNRGIIESITEGKQLHSYMGILQVVLEVCHETKYNFSIPNETLTTLVEVLQGISNQFAWEETTTSSDFAKISDMVNNIIEKSGFNTNIENDCKISGLHQIVLNCLWLNVKTSCELSSLLIKYLKDDKQIVICDKAINIISHVLETCRHKGAIEAAGTALGQSIQHLTSLPENTALSKFPLTFLKSKQYELISETAQMASVTRRGAGLSIMVHRVVSSDGKRGKPLFHYFMTTILDMCNKIEDIPNTNNHTQNIDSEKDMPKAIYIHFLTRIVTDSSLASDMMFYSVELVELAFGNLASPYWQIRNAALQLYGALVQKLIGQKKALDAEETNATVACDELRTHSSRLWNYILNQLQNRHYEDKLQYHSNLVPILNMLANIARRYNFSSDVFEKQEIQSDMLKNLMLLLDSPIFTVRRLTARCIVNIFGLDQIIDYLLNQGCSTENYIHGSLLLIANVYKCCIKDIHKNQILNELTRKYADILNAHPHSYLCREIFEDIFFDDIVTTKKVQQTLVELKANSQMPGICMWANKRILKYLHHASWDTVPELLMVILSQNENETYLSTLLDKIENENNITQKILLDMANILLVFKNKFKSFMIWKILYEVLLRLNQEKFELFDTTEIYNHIHDKDVSYKCRYMLPFAARLSVIGVARNQLAIISETIEKWTDPETTDVEMRYIAVIANNELGLQIKNLPEEVTITVMKSAIILVQDEDEDIRMECAKFYPLVTESKKSLQPYICLCNFLDHTFLDTILSKSGVCVLVKELTEYLSKVCLKNIDYYNPFANDSSNIYLEVDVLRHLIENL